MQSRKDFANSQRSSNIFDQEDANIRNSPNAGRSKAKDAYREALRTQMESDREMRNYEREHEDDHPLEMRVERYSIKPERGDEDYADGGEFFIGGDERNKKNEQRAIARDYASQLDEDMSRSHLKGNQEDYDDYAGRKPYQRTQEEDEEGEGFFIGRDEVAEKKQKKKDAIEFYREERRRLEQAPSPTRAAMRHQRMEDNEGFGNEGFCIGRDEKESQRSQAAMKVQYREELDRQKEHENDLRAARSERERESDLKMSKQKAPYSRF